MEADFPLRNVSPQGQNWVNLASLDRSRPERAMIIASFARRKRLRIELYLDGGSKDENKRPSETRVIIEHDGLERNLGGIQPQLSENGDCAHRGQ
jgi:hypothetical protein